MKINSVLGPIDTSDLGITLMHEHIALVERNMWSAFGEEWYDREHALRLFDNEMDKAKGHGLRTLVEATPINLGRDVGLLIDAAKRTKINILACTGLYWGEHPWYNEIDPEFMAEHWIKDLEVGMQGTEAKAAYVKCSTDVLYGASKANKAMVRAAGIASKRTGAPVYTHSWKRHGLYQLETLVDEGVEPHKIVIGHAFTSGDLEYLEAIVMNGAYVGCDQIAHEELLCPAELNAKNIAALCEKGYSRQIMLSNDTCVVGDFWFAMSRNRRSPDNPLYKSYVTLFERIVPMIRELGVTQEQLDDMLMGNPRRFFEGAPV